MREKRWFGPAQSAQPDVEQRARSLRLVISVLALFLGSATAFGQVKIPDTRAGHTLQAFLDAFNTGDRAKLRAFLDAFNSGDRASWRMAAERDSMPFFAAQASGFSWERRRKRDWRVNRGRAPIEAG
jgi:hypothetical protein